MNYQPQSQGTTQPATDDGTITLGRLIGREWPRYALAVVAVLLANLGLFAVPMIGRYAIDAVAGFDESVGLPVLASSLESFATEAGGRSLGAYLWLSAGLSVVVTATAGLFQYARNRLTALAAESSIQRVRRQLYQRLHLADATFFDQADTGDLVQRCSSDVDTLRVFLSDHIVELGRTSLLVLMALPVLLYMHWPLALLSLCLVPVLVIGAWWFYGRVHERFLHTDEAEGRLTGTLQQNLSGIRVVRAFHRQAFEIEKFARCNAEYRDCNRALVNTLAWFWSMSDLLALCQMGIVLMAGAALVSRGALSVGELFAFMTYVGMVIWPMRHMGRILADAGKLTVALARINHILSQCCEPQGRHPSIDRASGQICIRQLRFAYRSVTPQSGKASCAVLQDFNLHIRPGETIGIVGVPGSGKTSLVRVLLKLYDYDQGSIQLDGVELRELDRHWLREQIAVVFQEPFLYSRTISENLIVGRQDASDDKLHAACRDAALHESVMGFPAGYEALVGERGVTLSGGQRQRLALARALLKDPPILILDDALSAVDTATERQILNALGRRQHRHTTLIIAHRLSSVRHADRLVVLEQGRIVQVGTHAELAASPGQYQKLCAIQYELDACIHSELSQLQSMRPVQADRYELF